MRKEYYDTYKKLGICTACGKRKAKSGKVHCLECSLSDAKRVFKYDKKRKSEYNKRKRELCDAFGVCTTCMKRDKYKGSQCKECYTKRMEYYAKKQKEKGIVPRGERVLNDICYICGKPSVDGYSFCEEHLGKLRGNIAKGRAAIQKDTNYGVNKREIKNAYRRRRRELSVVFGVCGRCMRKDVYKGVLCIDCYLQSKRSYRESQNKKGIIPVSLRKGMGLCYICAKPVVDGYHLCEKHLKTARETATYARTFINKDNHHWSQMQYMESVRAKINNINNSVG